MSYVPFEARVEDVDEDVAIEIDGLLFGPLEVLSEEREVGGGELFDCDFGGGHGPACYPTLASAWKAADRPTASCSAWLNTAWARSGGTAFPI